MPTPESGLEAINAALNDRRIVGKDNESLEAVDHVMEVAYFGAHGCPMSGLRFDCLAVAAF